MPLIADSLFRSTKGLQVPNVFVICVSFKMKLKSFVSGPLITPSVPLHCWEGHGVNGLGGHSFADSPSRQPEKEIAALALIDIINADPGAYTLRMTKL